MDYKIIKEEDGEVFLEETPDDKKEIKEPEPETKELALIRARKNTEEEIIDADVIVTYFVKKNGARAPGYLEIKEYKNGKTVYFQLEAINNLSKIVNKDIRLILYHFGINRGDKCYYIAYSIIKSLIYGNYIINEIYRNGYEIFWDPESLGNFHYILYKELSRGRLSKEEYLEITQIDKISPYVERGFTLWSMILDRIKQKMSVKTIQK